MGAWRKLHDQVPIHLVSGDFDGNGIDDLAADFGSNGLWIRLNNNPWRKLRPGSGISKGLSVGDLDGNGADELICDKVPELRPIGALQQYYVDDAEGSEFTRRRAL